MLPQTAYLEATIKQLKQKETASVFSKQQATALKVLQKKGLPTSQNEAYRRTPFAQYLEEMHPIPTAKESYWPELPPLPTEEAPTIRLLNGQLPTEGLPKNLPKGLYLSLLSSAYESHPSYLQHAFSSPLKEEDTFAVLNEAAFEDGIFVYVSPHTTIPSLLLQQHAKSKSKASSSHPRMFIYLDKGSELSLIDTQSSSGDVHQNSVLEVFCAKDAHLKLYKLQDDSPGCLRIDHTYVMQSTGSLLQSFVFSTGGNILRNNLYVNLSAQGAKANLQGLYLCDKYSHIDNHSTLDHTSSHTHSDQNYKGVLSDRSRGVFNGRIFMRQGAVEATAYQSNKNLLLSPRAKVHTKPQLEIWVDDVRCSHGCTVGQFSPEQLLYLQSRGISLSVAKHLLLQAFAEELFVKLPEPQLANYFRNWLEKRLQKINNN